MTPDEVPDELVELLDDRAGKKHSRDGSVMTTLAEILTRWEQIRRHRIRAEAQRNPSVYDGTVAELRQRTVDAEGEAERLRSLLRDVDLHGQAFVYQHPVTGQKMVLHPAEVTVVMRHDAVTEMETLRNVADAADAWDQAQEAKWPPPGTRLTGEDLEAAETRADMAGDALADAVEEWRERHGGGER